MTVTECAEHLGLDIHFLADDAAKRNVAKAYCGDLLSDVMANVPADSVWFTIQGHVNIIAVAQLKDVACIVLVNGSAPDPQTLEKGKTFGISILGSARTSAELCMKLSGKL
jgi:hypothetical protein